MKTAEQTAREWLDEPAGFKGLPDSLAQVILADRREVVDRLEVWLEHGEECPKSWSDVDACNCGLDAAIAEILETEK